MKNKKLFKLYLILKYGLIWKKPVYLKRLFVIYLKIISRISKKGTVLRGVDFAINYTCNMRCEHCFDQTLIRDSKQMAVEDYARAAKQAMKLGCAYFGFQGGELFLRKDYLDVIKATQPRKNRITVTTNGLLINEERIKQLKRAGVDYLNFSLDSGIAEEHDKFRGVQGSFNKTMQAMQLCKKLKMKFTINTTVSHQSIKTQGFEKVAAFATKNKVLINTLFAAPAGNWENNKDVLMTEDDKKYYLELRKKYPFMLRDLESGYYGWGCPAVKEVLYITPYGDVLGCPFIQVSLGNLLNQDLKTIRENGLKIKHFADYPDECLMAEDIGFINQYLSNINDNVQLPIPLNKMDW